MPNSATEQALPNTGNGTYHHLATPSVANNQQIPNLCSKRPIFNAGPTDRHSYPNSNLVSAMPQSTQSLLSNADRLIQVGYLKKGNVYWSNFIQ